MSQNEDSLLKLHSDLEKMDQGLVDFDPELHREILNKTELKIDRYRYIFKKYESLISEIDTDIKELEARKKTLNLRVTALKKCLLWIMKEKGFTSLNGVMNVVKLMQRKKITMLVDEPDSSLFMKLPTLVKRAYTWDKKAFDKAYLKDRETLGQYAKEDVSEYIQFYLKRTLDE